VPLFSFRKGDKTKKMLEEGRIEDVVREALKNRKSLNHLIKLLDDENPGIVGDSLMAISMIVRENPKVVDITDEFMEKVFTLLLSKTAYVRDGAMALSLEIAKTYKDRVKDSFSRGVERLIKEGDKTTIAFALLLIKELKLSEFRDTVTSLTEVEDKVILPFEGRRWVRIADIAREVLESL